MKYTNTQINKMILDYFRAVATNNWERMDETEAGLLLACSRFIVLEDMPHRADTLGGDMLLFINGDIKNYHVFLIKEGKLIELHQEHHFRWCLTCEEMGEKSPYIDRAE